MKIILHEYDGYFMFDLEAETVADAALIARLGANATKEVRGIYTTAERSGSFSGSVVLGKEKRASDYLPRRRK